MARYYGFNGIVGAGVESTFGTAVARSNWFQVMDFTPTETVTNYQPMTLRRKGGFRTTSPVGVKQEYTLSWNGEFTDDYLGLILEAAMGAAVATTGSGPYTHTYAPGDTGQPAKFLTIEGGLGSSGDSVLYRGVCVNSLTLNITPNDVVKYSVDCIAQRADSANTAGSPTYASAYTFVNGATDITSITWNSVTLSNDELGSVSVTLNNNLQTSFGVGDIYTNIPFYSGDGKDIEVSIDVQYGSVIANALRTANAAQTQSDLVITLTIGSNTVTITVRNAYVDSSCIPPLADADDMRYTAVFRGVSDSTDPAFEIVVVNGSSSGIANA